MHYNKVVVMLAMPDVLLQNSIRALKKPQAAVKKHSKHLAKLV
jgi:hypothetical protein